MFSDYTRPVWRIWGVFQLSMALSMVMLAGAIFLDPDGVPLSVLTVVDISPRAWAGWLIASSVFLLWYRDGNRSVVTVTLAPLLLETPVTLQGYIDGAASATPYEVAKSIIILIMVLRYIHHNPVWVDDAEKHIRELKRNGGA